MYNVKMFRRISSITIGAFFLIFYVATLAPDLLWGDPAKLVLYVHNNHFSTDIIGGHLVHTMLGRLFALLPYGSLPWKLNFMSAFFGVLTIVIFNRWVFEYTRSYYAANIASMILGLSHIFWLTAVINESYSLVHFFFVLWFWLLLRWDQEGKLKWLYLSFFVYGLSLSNHLLPGFALPALIGYLLSSQKFRRYGVSRWILCLLSFSLGGTLLIIAFLNSAVHSQSSGSLFSLSAWMKSVEMFTHSAQFLKELVRYPFYTFYQFPLIGFFLAFLGMMTCLRENRRIFFLTAGSFFRDSPFCLCVYAAEEVLFSWIKFLDRRFLDRDWLETIFQ